MPPLTRPVGAAKTPAQRVQLGSCLDPANLASSAPSFVQVNNRRDEDGEEAGEEDGEEAAAVVCNQRTHWRPLQTPS